MVYGQSKILNPYYVSVKERHHCVGEIGDNGIDKDGISANTPNDGIGKSDTSACCNSEQPSLSLIWAIMFMTETERKT